MVEMVGGSSAIVTFSQFFLIPSRQMIGQYLCLATATSVLIISSSSVMNHPAFLSCIVRVTSSVVLQHPHTMMKDVCSIISTNFMYF